MTGLSSYTLPSSGPIQILDLNSQDYGTVYKEDESMGQEVETDSG